MIRPACLLACATLLAAATGCNKAPTQSTAPAAQPAVAQQPARPPAMTAPAPVQDFTLTMDRVDAYIGAIRNLGVLAQKDPSLEDITAMNASEEDENQYAARLRKHPAVAAAIASAGLTPEEFAQTGSALMAGMMTAGAMESGALKKIPDGIDPQFVEFARQNKAALAAKLKSMQTAP